MRLFECCLVICGDVWLLAVWCLWRPACDDRWLDVIFSEHIWPVTVKAKGLSGNRDKGIPPGSYRLCLTNTDVSLIRLYSDKPDVVVPVSIEYQLFLSVPCSHWLRT